MNYETEEIPEAICIKTLFLEYFEEREDLKNQNDELNTLLANPVTYNNETDITALQRIIDYHDQLNDIKTYLEQEEEKLTAMLFRWQSGLVEIFQTIGLPPNNKISVDHSGVMIRFWYDEDGWVEYEVVG